jgi:hypothetical protein
VTYDALAESLRLIDGGPIAGSEPLTRRHRVLPVALDVDVDIAVTVFLRRAHGGAEWQNHLLSRGSEGWHLLGGGGWGFDDLDVLTRVRTSVELGGPARASGAGGVAVSRNDLPTSRARWLSYAMIDTTAAVDRVSLSGLRTVVRPVHGHIVVIWRGAERVSATVLGGSGQTLCTLQLGS